MMSKIRSCHEINYKFQSMKPHKSKRFADKIENLFLNSS